MNNTRLEFISKLVILIKSVSRDIGELIFTENTCRKIRLPSRILFSEGNNMYKEDRLPQNSKEGLVFLLIISIISANTIGPIIVGLERGFSKENYLETLKVLPFLWIIVVLIVILVAGPLVGKILPKFVEPTDGFNARVLLNTLLNVTVISILMTIIGAWVGTKQISIEPFQNFFHSWFRNFGVAFWIELLVAQPIARLAMKKIHAKQRSKLVTEKL